MISIGKFDLYAAGEFTEKEPWIKVNKTDPKRCGEGMSLNKETLSELEKLIEDFFNKHM